MNDMEVIKSIDNVQVWQEDNALLWKSGATICGDGSPHCYHPHDSQGLDYLANAGSPGQWWGIATDNNGKPYVQSIYDPAPGYYVSTTALVDPNYPNHYPERYIDSERYPYLVVPGQFGYNWKVGDVGFVYNTHTHDNMYCATGDIGPTNHIGEISMLLAKCLKMNPDPKKGGAESGIVYVVFPGSDPGYDTWRAKCKVAIDTFTKWGGMSRLKALWGNL
jgi:hypothetical protein